MDRREFVQQYLLEIVHKAPDVSKVNQEIRGILYDANKFYDTIDADPKIVAEQTAKIEGRNASTYYNAITGDQDDKTV